MRSVRLTYCFVFLVLLFVGGSARAYQETRMSLRQGEATGSWSTYGGAQGNPTTRGVELTATATGYLLADVQFDLLPQAATVVTTSERDLQIYFVWTVLEDGKTNVYAAPLIIFRGENIRTPIPLSDYPLWEAGVKQVGFQIQPGQSLVVSELTIGRWNAVDRFVEYVRSFWRFNTYKPYSINFVWGPFVTGNSVQREFLYEFQQPMGVSASLPAFIVLLALILGIAGYSFITIPAASVRWQKTLRASAMLILGFWLLFDLRMGTEFLSWVLTDMRQYIFAPRETRTFRDRDRFYDFLSFAAPYVKDRERYVFFASDPWPYFGSIRYATYPSIPTDDFKTNDTWVIYDRPDLSVGPSMQIVSSGQAATHPGEVLARFDEHSFIFRVHPPPPSPSPP